MIAVFVTSHGFGHLNRTVAVLNRIPADRPITIYCHQSLFTHWHERLSRPASFVGHVCDSGAVNPLGDSAATDGRATIELARSVHRQALAGREAMVEHLRSSGTRVILSDAASMPLTYARALKIPGYLLANFTWADIYESHAKRLGAEALAFVSTLRAEYRQATAFLRTEPALAMTHYGVPVENVGMVMSPSHSKGDALRATFGLGKNETLVYFYIGRYGQADLEWGNLAKLERKGYHFVGFHPAPVGPIANLHVVDPHVWTGSDLAHSSDVMVTKAGYGTVCEALASRTPMLYPPRTGFAEHRALDRALTLSGGGIRTSAQAFLTLKIEKQLDRARGTTPGPPPFAVDGASRVAKFLLI